MSGSRVFASGRRHCNRHGVHLAHARFVSCRLEFPGLQEILYFLGRDISDVRLARHQSVYNGLAHIVSDHAESSFCKLQRERKTNVAESDNADACLAIVELAEQAILHALTAANSFSGHRIP
jgi:hypothetical protein